MSKKKVRLKKKALIFIILFVVVICGGVFTVFKLKKDKEIKLVKGYYFDTVYTSKNTKLYSKRKSSIGTIEKDVSLNLDGISGKYFKIKDTEYYVYYNSVKENKDKKDNKEVDNGNYVPFNKNIKTDKKVSLIKDGKEIIVLNKGIDTPILSMDNENYYVSFLNDTYVVKKDSSIKEIDSNNTKDKTADHVSVLFYEFISDSCSDYNCTTTENLKNEITKLKENGYYTINTEEFKNYISGMKNLKEKAILINTANFGDNITNLNNELGVNIEKLDETANYRFISTYKAAKSGVDQKRIDRYQVKSYTSVDDVLRMANGEEVKQSSDEEVNKQGVPVLNYHFFYDPNEDVCDESICLEVSKFREHLEYLKNNNFKTLTIEEFRKWMYGEIEVPSKSVLITVDDGAKGTGKHNGNKLNPLLEEYHLNATLFLITGWWDIENYRGDYLDIQSHTNDMHQYGTCGRGQINCATYEEAKADLQQSINRIGNTDSFCFPFYMTSDTALKAVKDLGFKLSFVGGSVNAKRTNNKWLIPRYPIHSNITMDRFKSMVD